MKDYPKTCIVLVVMAILCATWVALAGIGIYAYSYQQRSIAYALIAQSCKQSAGQSY